MPDSSQPTQPTQPTPPKRPTRLGRPTGWRRAVFRAPIALYRWRMGWLLGGRFVLVNHVGRTSGKPRTAVLEVVDRSTAGGTVTVASGYGPTTDWYRNLRAHPDVSIQIGRRAWPVTAVLLSDEDGGEAFSRYAARHPRAARTLAGYMGLTVDGSAESYRAAAHQLPWVRFEPRAS